MAERASAHIARGWARRSAVRSIQSMVPWRPAATNSASLADAGQGASTRAKPQASKPSAFASSRISCLAESEVEVVIVRRRRQAGPAVGEQRAETRPGFQLHVPGLGAGDFPP